MKEIYPDFSSEENIDFELLEQQLENDLKESFHELEILKEDRAKISSPESLSSIMMGVVWDQFINQVGVVAGEDFIKANRGLTLDLGKDSHIQTTENFAKGKIAAHNTGIDYQQRYDDWQNKLEHDSDGNIKTHTTRSGKQVANVKKDARAPFDKNRPSGSSERGTAIDHTISAAEIIRDPAANAHLTQEEQVAFANSKENLSEINARANSSKKDTPTGEWLDNPNSKGKYPKDNPDFGITDDVEKELREKDAQAREEYERVKKEGEKRSIEAGKQSIREEALRITGKALRAVVVGLMADLMKRIAQHLIKWLKSAERNLNTFLTYVKNAIMDFIHNLKQSVMTAGDTLITTIATSIIGPVVSLLKKAWIFLKQGYKSLKQAIDYIRDSKSNNVPFNIMMLEVGKIIIAGLTAGGAIVLSETIEKALMTFPVFNIQIPLFGSLASILGIFFGAVTSGIIGALALSLIDKAIERQQMINNDIQTFDKRNQIISQQLELISVAGVNMQIHKTDISSSISSRHQEAYSIIEETVNSIKDCQNDCEAHHADNSDKLNDILNKLDIL